MSEASIKEEVKEPLIHSWAIWIALIVFAGALAIYAIQFSWGSPRLSPNPETWGQLGDYLGGMVNPIIGLITIWLLAASLKQNQIALQQSKEALEQAEEEVRLTRAALEQSQAIQKATEDALKEQINIAAHTRDMNNVIALWSSLESQRQPIEKELGDRMELLALSDPLIYNRLQVVKTYSEKLGKIIDLEVDRLTSRY